MKIGNWLMAAGALVAFIGLCFLPAAFGADGDRTMLGAGAMVIAVGTLCISAGFYFKARDLRTASASTNAAANTRQVRGKSSCDQCGQDEPVIQCRVHQIHLCTACLWKHYDFRSCAYVPSTRRGVIAKSNASAYAQTASS
jgi:ribosomal protein S14